MTIPCPLRQQARLRPGAPAIVARHRTFTFEDWHRGAAYACTQLSQTGLGEGDIVCVALPPCTPYPILLMALARLGAAAFPVDTRFPVEYLLGLLRRLDCRTMITPYGASVTAQQGNFLALAPRDLISEALPPLDSPYEIDLERPATIVLTSGSAGAAKAAVHTFGNHYHSALRANANMPLGPGDRWLLSLPMHHVAGLGVVFRCLLAGAAIAVPPAKEGLAECIAQLGATHVSLVATQLYRLMKSAEGLAALRKLKAILLGGGPIPEALVREAHALGLPIYTSYGMTETATQICSTAPGESFEKLLTSGKPLERDTLRVSAGGEIHVRGETLFLGYADAAALRLPLTEDGWFATGDLGELDADGYLHVLGRKDNMFIAGGENIQPEEIEAALQDMPEVRRAVVVPAPDVEFGQLPGVFIETVDGNASDAEALRAVLRSRLPHFKVPRYVWPWPVDLCGVGEKPKRGVFAERAAAMLRTSTKA